jgi:hypothetical protein
VNLKMLVALLLSGFFLHDPVSCSTPNGASSTSSSSS